MNGQQETSRRRGALRRCAILEPRRRRLAIGGACIHGGSLAGIASPPCQRAIIARLTEEGTPGCGLYAGAGRGGADPGDPALFQRKLVFEAGASGPLRATSTRARTAIPAYFDRLPTGDVMSVFTNDLNAVQ